MISAGLIAALVVEGWPGALLRRPGAGRVVTLVFTAAAAAGLNRALAGYADSVHWVRATANDWGPSRGSPSARPTSSCT